MTVDLLALFVHSDVRCTPGFTFWTAQRGRRVLSSNKVQITLMIVRTTRCTVDGVDALHLAGSNAFIMATLKTHDCKKITIL